MTPKEMTETPAAPLRREPLPLEFPGVHHMDQEEIEAAARTLAHRSLFRYYGVDLQGEVDAFEQEFAQQIGARYALAVTSGTGALSVALAALGVGPGQEVIIPAYLWVSVASAVIHQGAIPVLGDIDDTFCLDPADVERKIGPRTAGVILVHMSGAPGDAPAIRQITARRGLFLLEDCAQCVGGRLHGQAVGTFGDMGIYSFQMNKNMTAGEGGCVVTSDPRLYRRAFAAHDMGYPRENGRLDFADPELCLWGKGVRMDELRAAVLRVQLRKLPAIIGRMRSSKWRIRRALEELPGVQFRRILDPEGDTGCFLILTFPSAGQARLVNEMTRADGIRTAPQGISNILMTDWGLHIYWNNVSLVRRSGADGRGFPWTLPANEGLGHDYARGACPQADSLFERSILLPIPSCLTRRDEDDIIAAFRKAILAQAD
jgi:8-amino-3,8-dideoxy-alpha-D-manno-octulosonate transaminase